MMKLAHRETTWAPLQIGVGTNIGVPTRTSQGGAILEEVQKGVKENFGHVGQDTKTSRRGVGSRTVTQIDTDQRLEQEQILPCRPEGERSPSQSVRAKDCRRSARLIDLPRYRVPYRGSASPAWFPSPYLNASVAIF